MPKLGSILIAVVFAACAFLGACNREPQSTGPKFTGRVILLSGDTTVGANLIELTPAPANATYNLSTLASGVFEAAASTDRTRLIYTTKDEIIRAKAALDAEIRVQHFRVTRIYTARKPKFNRIGL